MSTRVANFECVKVCMFPCLDSKCNCAKSQAAWMSMFPEFLNQ
uniref:Uncharacterized protein n=1 Tax=Arundo donax TaxID=35708 RepID=A0A0A9B0Q6_ARUDO